MCVSFNMFGFWVFFFCFVFCYKPIYFTFVYCFCFFLPKFCFVLDVSIVNTVFVVAGMEQIFSVFLCFFFCFFFVCFILFTLKKKFMLPNQLLKKAFPLSEPQHFCCFSLLWRTIAQVLSVS